MGRPVACEKPIRMFLSFILSVTFSTGYALSAGAEPQKIASNLEQYLSTKQPSEMVRVLVMLRDRVDLHSLEGAAQTRQARHELVVTSLMNTATEAQGNLAWYLDDKVFLGEVKSYRQFWITNLVAFEAQRSVIEEVATMPEVEMIYHDYPVEPVNPVAMRPAESAPGSAEPGLRDINAHKLWELGITGEGVIVMNIDTGVDGAHPALSARWRGNEPGVDPHWAWFNPDNPNQTFPVDFASHGTHTMGTLTGLAPGTNDTIGVAFGAQWIAAAWNYVGLNKFISDVIREFEWAADPDGNAQTVDDVPAVCSNSWGIGVLFGQPPCDESFWVAIDGAEAAGVAVVFAAGNEGPSAQSLRAPAERNTSPTNVLSVGALNAGSMTIASFSSRGPTACPGTTEERIKPEVCARGVGVRSSIPGNGYTTLDGTSMACPHVAGAIALLRQAFPDATVDELKNALLETAVDLGIAGEDNTYGHGRIDVWAAYNMLLGGGGAIPCSAFSSLLTRCLNNGTIQARVTLLNSTQYAGEVVTFQVDGDLYPATIVTNGLHSRAQIVLPGSTPGTHSVSLADPPGCLDPSNIACPAAGKLVADDEWAADEALWAEAGVEANVTSYATALTGNYPNPFNPSTTIRYSIEQEARVTLTIYNTLGQQVATLVDQVQTPGSRTVSWNGRTDLGVPVSSGIYLVRLSAGIVVQTRKILLMK